MDPPDLSKMFARPVDVNVSPHQLEDQDRFTFISLSSPLAHNSTDWWTDLLDLYNSTSREQSLAPSLLSPSYTY